MVLILITGLPVPAPCVTVICCVVPSKVRANTSPPVYAKNPAEVLSAISLKTPLKGWKVLLNSIVCWSLEKYTCHGRVTRPDTSPTIGTCGGGKNSWLMWQYFQSPRALL